MKVQTSFKTPNAIEKMGIKDWEELLKTLQSFSKKMEANFIKKGHGRIVRAFSMSATAVKSLLEEGKRGQSCYTPGEYEIYGSPYPEDLPNSSDLYSKHSQARHFIIYFKFKTKRNSLSDYKTTSSFEHSFKH